MSLKNGSGLKGYVARARLPMPELTGVITKVVGLLIEATAPGAAVGDFYNIDAGGSDLRAEVVALKAHHAVLLPFGQLAGLKVGAPLYRLAGGTTLPVGEGLLGRVIDALGHPLDGGAEVLAEDEVPVHALPLSLSERAHVTERLPTGVRALDAFVPLGVGQRLGIFAGPGVGKSTLLGMLAQGCDAEIIVMALVGERGREVGHFVDAVLGQKSRHKSIIIAATSDRPASERVRAAFAATAIAEYFRGKNKKVLLFVDSLTRLCMAQRDIGLAVGEPPTSKGYPPSAFALLPRLIERVAPSKGRGSITGIYTVLVEGDDMSEPVADATRGLLDGHIVLSRALAARGHFPAIDVLQSLSRLESDLMPAQELEQARSVRALLARLEESRELVSIGAYKAGSDPMLDTALTLQPTMQSFLRQRSGEALPLGATQKRLFELAVSASQPDTGHATQSGRI